MIDLVSAMAGVARTGIDRVTAQRETIERAGTCLADVIAAGGVVHCYGTGHSRIVTLELCGRAGGLAAMNWVTIKDLVLRKGWDPRRIADPTVERDPSLGVAVWEMTAARAGDAFVIVSNSGRNASVVEVATRAEELGLPIVAVTSMQHTSSVTSGHASGRLLRDLASIVIDNASPLGDAALTLDGGASLGAVSSITGTLIAQLLQAAVCQCLLSLGVVPPLLRSQNVPGGDERNARLYAEWSRVQLIEP